MSSKTTDVPIVASELPSINSKFTMRQAAESVAALETISTQITGAYASSVIQPPTRIGLRNSKC